MRVAFAGLGVMGFPMAGHLARAGHEVTVFNRTPDKAAKWVETYGGRSAPTVAEAAKGAELFLLCVGADDDVRAVVGEALPALGEGAIVVDHTTASAAVAREMAEKAAARGVGFVDAPVSGGQAGAENGQLTIMCGGSAGNFARVQPAVAPYTKAIRLINDGARFIATNPDVTGPSAEGPLPATGSVAALITKATGRDPYFVGKPNPMMFRSALNRIEAHSEQTIMVGDRMDTDVVAGIEAGLETILVLTGSTERADVERYPFRPSRVLDSIADAVSLI